MPVSGIESGPQQLHARTQGCANYDFKDKMSPNYELPDTIHCFLGNKQMQKRQFSYTHHSKWNNNRKSRPWCVRQLPYICLTIRHTCKSRLTRFECEYGWKCQRAHKKHTCVRLKQIELALFTLCDGSFVFCDVATEISAKVIVRRQSTRFICTRSNVGSVQLLELAYMWDPP